ncbi:Metallothionein expression activator [Quaeritorhiza haematococci]|nr:Metallothionein expression activator [Quaeritorhiza haematococci]
MASAIGEDFDPSFFHHQYSSFTTSTDEFPSLYDEFLPPHQPAPFPSAEHHQHLPPLSATSLKSGSILEGNGVHGFSSWEDERHGYPQDDQHLMRSSPSDATAPHMFLNEETYKQHPEPQFFDPSSHHQAFVTNQPPADHHLIDLQPPYLTSSPSSSVSHAEWTSPPLPSPDLGHASEPVTPISAHPSLALPVNWMPQALPPSAPATPTLPTPSTPLTMTLPLPLSMPVQMPIQMVPHPPAPQLPIQMPLPMPQSPMATGPFGVPFHNLPINSAPAPNPKLPLPRLHTASSSNAASNKPPTPTSTSSSSSAKTTTTATKSKTKKESPPKRRAAAALRPLTTKPKLAAAPPKSNTQLPFHVGVFDTNMSPAMSPASAILPPPASMISMLPPKSAVPAYPSPPPAEPISPIAPMSAPAIMPPHHLMSISPHPPTPPSVPLTPTIEMVNSAAHHAMDQHFRNAMANGAQQLQREPRTDTDEDAADDESSKSEGNVDDSRPDIVPSLLQQIRESGLGIGDDKDTVTYPCPFPGCDRVFTRLYNVKSHLICHSGDRPHVCSQCPASFRRKHDLQRHYRTSHSGEKPWSCPKCSRRFARKDHYRRHLQVEEMLEARMVLENGSAAGIEGAIDMEDEEGAAGAGGKKAGGRKRKAPQAGKSSKKVKAV